MVSKKLNVCLSTFLFLSYAAFVHANPESPTVISGDVDFNTVGNVLTVESESNRSIVEWESFSISGNQTTSFVLPTANAAILNRVTGTDPSTILGTLSSNGQVFLINTHGILFGSDSVINTQTFLASTLDCLDEEFLNEVDMTFTGDESDVFLTNNGTITALGGDIILMSYQIENNGDLIAEDGGVALGSGVEIIYQPFSDDRIAVVNHSTSTPVSLGMNVVGTIVAPSVELKADGNLYELAISHEGLIDAIGGGDGAFVRFVAADGATFANGTINANFLGYGGRIDITGQDVEVSSSAIIDASAPYGQGVVNIGGGFNGTDSDVLNAETTLVDGSYIDVSADTLGNGGTVIVWADSTNTYIGTIAATGGSVGGDGGFVQIGAAEGGCYNNFGSIDVSASIGDPGVVDLHGECCSCE